MNFSNTLRRDLRLSSIRIMVATQKDKWLALNLCYVIIVPLTHNQKLSHLANLCIIAITLGERCCSASLFQDWPSSSDACQIKLICYHNLTELKRPTTWVAVAVCQMRKKEKRAYLNTRISFKFDDSELASKFFGFHLDEQRRHRAHGGSREFLGLYEHRFHTIFAFQYLIVQLG